jgi:Fur family ferric uptake transcriptional regulator
VKSSLGQRNTRQREVVFQVFRSAGRPLTVNEIHELAVAQHDRIGVATVYRTVKLLAEAGQITEVHLPNEQLRYELADAHGHHHHHCACQQCGKVFCLDLCPVGLPDDTVLPDGFLVQGHAVTLYGICADCRN